MPRFRRDFPGFVLVLALFLAACGSSAASVAPTIPPDATGSLVPAATATPAPSPSDTPAPAFPVTLTDDEGTTVTLAAAPKEIVSLTPAETEILYAIGAGDRVVGKVEDIADYPPEAKAVPVVGTFSGVDVEKIVSLGTDLVIAGGNGGTQPDAIQKLRDLKIPVLVLYASDVDGVYRDISLTGDAVGASEEAGQLVSTMKSGFADVASALTGAQKPRVFYETGDQPSIYGIADDSVYAQMITLAGGTPVTTGSATNWEQSTEKLVQADPQLIILGDSAYGVTANAVKKRAGWGAISAVKDGKIVGIDDIIVTRPGPRLVDGLRALVAAIHPELALGSPAPSPSGS